MTRLGPALLLALGGCTKVPLVPVDARFLVADVTWFEEEQTLFVFWDVEAEQGLNASSVVEIRYITDAGAIGWTPLEAFAPVHTHVPADCGPNRHCGSWSIAAPLEPRALRMRLRYHRDGAMVLDAPVAYNVIGAGDPATNRSLIVYGVFDETNTFVQWRARHQFPTLRNHHVTELGLRRRFVVERVSHGNGLLGSPDNPYAYGVDCPTTFAPTPLPPVETDERAIFSPDPIPDEARSTALLCGQATVTDATGPFTTGAVARKNPEVRAAFPVLRSPVEEVRQVRLFLGPCSDPIDPTHEAMQRQRLLMEDIPTTCIDGWRDPDFADNLTAQLRDAVDEAREEGRDMVLLIGLHREEAGVADVVEEALAQVVPAERHRSSPRLAGAFVFDSAPRTMDDEDLERSVLWCPAPLTATGLSISCAVLPNQPQLDLGPLSFTQLPILPSRSQYLDFIEEFGEAQAGSVEAITISAPVFPVDAAHFDLGPFGVTTFMPGDLLSAAPEDAFSYCAPEEPDPIMVTSPLMQDPFLLELLLTECDLGQLPPDLCGALGAGAIPLEFLGDWHRAFPEPDYAIGLWWIFPYLFQLDYRAVIAGNASAIGVTIPFGIGSPAEQVYGDPTWSTPSFPLDRVLTQCVRFCDHPVFDAVGAYQIRSTFRDYGRRCYRPLYPLRSDGGFPLDP